MIASFMERYATRAGLEGISAEDFLAVYGRSVGEPRPALVTEAWGHGGGLAGGIGSSRCPTASTSPTPTRPTS